MKKIKAILILAILLLSGVTLHAQEIIEAAKKGDLDRLKELIEKNPQSVNIKDSSGCTPLHWACQGVNPEILKYLFGKGADVNARDNNGLSPLDKAANRGKKEIIDLLLDKGADYDTTGDRALHMLRLSAWHGLERLFKVATVKGGTRLFYDKAANRITIDIAIKGGSVEIVKMLIANNITLEDKADIYGQTTLHYAAKKGAQAMIEFLVKNGFDINCRNGSGESAYNIATSDGNKDMQSLIISLGGNTNPQKVPTLYGLYLGQTPPEKNSKLFAPGIISTGYGELNSVFTADGKEFYFSRRGIPGKPSAIMVSKMINNVWSLPAQVEFTGTYSNIDIFITSDAGSMIFCSDRPNNKGDKAKKDHDFWISKRQGTGWGEPAVFAPEAVSSYDDFFPVVTRSGNLYFNSQRGGPGTNDIYCSEFVNGKYLPAEKLPAPINSEFREFDAYITPDEMTMIYSSVKPGGFGGSDIYISYKKKDGSWSEPINPGNDINSPGSEYGATITPDGNYLFYTSTKNGTEDIYWVSSEFIEAMRPKE